MIEWDFTAVRVLAIVTVIIGGYITHELLHVLPLAVAGVDYSIEFNPENKPLWYALTVGKTFSVPAKDAPRGVAVLSLLAPGIVALPAVVLWALVLKTWATGGVVSASSAALVMAWFFIFLPSAADWISVYRIVNTCKPH